MGRPQTDDDGRDICPKSCRWPKGRTQDDDRIFFLFSIQTNWVVCIAKEVGHNKRCRKDGQKAGRKEQTAVDAGVRPSGSRKERTEKKKNNMGCAWISGSGGRWVRWAHRAGRLHIQLFLFCRVYSTLRAKIKSKRKFEILARKLLFFENNRIVWFHTTVNRNCFDGGWRGKRCHGKNKTKNKIETRFHHIVKVGVAVAVGWIFVFCFLFSQFVTSFIAFQLR